MDYTLLALLSTVYDKVLPFSERLFQYKNKKKNEKNSKNPQENKWNMSKIVHLTLLKS